jgi:hypothetical protein
MLGESNLLRYSANWLRNIATSRFRRSVAPTIDTPYRIRAHAYHTRSANLRLNLAPSKSHHISLTS